jgi:hypothetical protein
MRHSTTGRATRVLLVLGSLAVSLGLCEAVVRLGRTADADANYYFRGRHLKPYRLPLTAVRRTVAELESAASTALIYDSFVGWTPRPHGHSRDGLAFYDAAGIRTSQTLRDYTLRSAPGVVRVALFGDSFTHCDDVSLEQSWGFHLESRLRHQGIDAEVLNFGVGGYGIDQAYLRWQRIGRSFNPDIVVLGFQPENVLRSVNLIRHLYMPRSGLPFSKPRFILRGDELAVVNVPTVTPTQLLETLEHLDSWDLRQFESFYNARDYEDRLWLKSQALAFVAKLVDDWRTSGEWASAQVPPAEAITLVRRIIAAFRADVATAGAHFVIVHLPTHYDLSRISTGRLPSWYADLLAELKTSYEVVETADALLAEAASSSLDELFVGHYSNRANEIVASSLAEPLATRFRKNGAGSERTDRDSTTMIGANAPRTLRSTELY